MMGRLSLQKMQKQKPGILGGMLLRLLVQRLFVPTLILVILFQGLAGFMAHRSLDAQQIETVRIVANSVETFLKNAENMLRSSARVADFSTPNQLAFYLKSYRQGFAYFDTIYRIDNRGIIVQLEPDEPRYMGLDQSRQPFFAETNKKKGLYISRPFNSMRTGQPTVNMTWPLADEGMMVAELNLGAFQAAVAAARHEQGNRAIIIMDQSGTFLAHPHPEYIAQQARMENFSIMQHKMITEATLHYRFDNQWMLGSYTHVPSTGWVVLVQVPLAAIHGALFKLAIPVIVFCLLLWTFVALNFKQRFWRHVIAPLTDLSQTAIAISSGDLDRSVKVEKEDEIGVVAKAFNSMTAQLRDVIGRLEERVDQLTQAREELKTHQEQLEELVQVRTAALSERTQQLESQALELSAAKQQAEFANAAKSEFLAHMSHEIRTPLNAVTGLTHIILKSELTDAQRDDLRKVQIASSNLLSVINDILDFSKVEAGRLELEHHPFGLDQVIDQLADLFSDQLSLKDLEIIFDLNPNMPNRVIGDAGRLTQVLTNLVANAIKFTPQGEIVISGRLDDQAGADSGSTVIKFQVSDTGAGIPAELLPNLFEPFTQAEDYLTRRHEGTGLGLAICRRLVELMGGRIWAESTPGRGSAFSFTVLLETEQDGKRRVTVPEDLHGLKTLVVDGSATARQTLSDILKSFTFKVFTSDSVEDAIEELRKASGEDPYQLVLLDWKIHAMDGIEAARRINAIGGEDRDFKLKVQNSEFNVQSSSDSSDRITCHAPSAMRHKPHIIIMATAFGHKRIPSRIDTSDVGATISKPVKPSELFNTIMALVGRPEAAVSYANNSPITLPNNILADRRVLVVEDSALNLDVAVALLKATGLAVDIADNGKVAVEKITGAPAEFYDAVLMDIQMPVMDGYEATQRIRQWESGRQGSPIAGHGQPATGIPIIALTAHALIQEKDRCFSAGMDDYLSKPIVEQELHRVLLKWIKHQLKNE